jgi:hypothetical protein
MTGIRAEEAKLNLRAEKLEFLAAIVIFWPVLCWLALERGLKLCHNHRLTGVGLSELSCQKNGDERSQR